MPVATYQKSLTLNGIVETGRLFNELVGALIPVIGVNDSTLDFFKIEFSSNLSEEQATAVLDVIEKHTGEKVEDEPARFQEVLPVGGQRVTDRGFQFDATAGQTTYYDFVVTEDLYIKEGFALAYDFNKRDSVSMAIVHPLAGPLHYYLKDLPLDVHRGDKTIGIVRAKNAAITETNFNGLTIRMSYTSTGVTDVHVCVTMRTYS